MVNYSVENMFYHHTLLIIDLKLNLKNPYVSVCLQTHPPNNTYLVHALLNYAFTFGDLWEMTERIKYS